MPTLFATPLVDDVQYDAAHRAIDTVMSHVRTPNYLALWQMAAPGCSFRFPSIMRTDISGALKYMETLRNAFPDLGHYYEVVEQVFSDDGTSMACVVRHTVTLLEPFKFSDGTVIAPAPGKSSRTIELCVAIAISTRGDQITSWITSLDVAHYQELLHLV
jgi:hypothetical protein